MILQNFLLVRQGSELRSPPATHILKGWPKTAEFFQTIGDGWVAWPSPLEDRNPSGPVPLTAFSFLRIVSDSKVSWGSELGFAVPAPPPPQPPQAQANSLQWAHQLIMTFRKADRGNEGSSPFSGLPILCFPISLGCTCNARANIWQIQDLGAATKNLRGHQLLC